MPASPDLSYPGLAILAWVLFVYLLSAAGAVIASAIILGRYRRSIARWMQDRSPTVTSSDPHAAASPGEDGAARGSVVLPAEGHEASFGESLYGSTVRESRRLAYLYAIAGALFALGVGTAAYLALSQLQVNYLRAAGHPLQLVLLTWIAAWPVVLTVSQVASPSPRSTFLLVVAYFASFAALGAVMSALPTEAPVRLGEILLPAWAGESPLRLAMRWLAFNLAPTALILVFRRRRLRTIAPLVLGFTTVVAAGVLGVIAAAFVYQDASVRAIAHIAQVLDTQAAAALAIYLALLGIAAAVVFTLLGWLALVWIRRAYRRKTISDQSLGIEAQWLVFAVFYAGLLAYAGPGWCAAPLLAFFAARSLLAAWQRTTLASRQAHAAALLVLRVFSLGPQSEALFDALTRRWRHAGSVILIAGPDLALSTLAPRQFLAFVSGRLQRLFVRSPGEVDSALDGLDRRADADGRFRINDFFCTADSWQPMLARLLAHSDAVLMDLRGFHADNAGCIFEVRALLHAMPLSRLVFVIDATTDRTTLARTMDEALDALPNTSPNRGLRTADVRMFVLDRVSFARVQRLLQALCDTAVAPARRLAAESRSP